jgi:hypothetical protein
MQAQLSALNEQWCALMRAGRFAEAWKLSDAAQDLRRDLDCSSWPRHEQFIWNGASLRAQRVLVRCYHGLGDTIQYLRFLKRLRSVAREVTLWVQPTLVPLLAYIDGADHVRPLHDGVPEVDYDVDIEISELMHALRVTPETLAGDVPYIRVAGSKVARPSSALQVGFVWSSGSWDSRRSLNCDALASWRELSSIDWHVLQRGPALSQWRYDFARVPDIHDIIEEARVMMELDLLITVDTCSAHLGGALGVPTWTLLCSEADWRWMRDRDDTPWYPTMRLFRQRVLGDWQPVLQEVRRALQAL